MSIHISTCNSNMKGQTIELDGFIEVSAFFTISRTCRFRSGEGLDETSVKHVDINSHENVVMDLISMKIHRTIL